LLESVTKRHGARLICEQEGCGHTETLIVEEKAPPAPAVV
jgi:hypothetical protein